MSTPAHTSLTVAGFDQNGRTPVLHPPLFTRSCSERLLYLFLQMKKVLKRKCFVDVEEVEQKMTEAQKRPQN